MKNATITALNHAMATRQPVAFAKNLSDGTEFLLPDPHAPEALNEAGRLALAADKSTTHVLGSESWFIEARNPAPRLVLVGAVHIAQALAPLASMSGFEVILIDPRQGFGNQERFPGANLVNDWPDEALNQLKPDMRTAVVTLTHDPKLDDPALDRALHSNAFYIGALGSRKTHAARLERLSALGHQAESLQRIRGPVGLDIGSVTTPEIALSIIAEIVAVRRGGSLGLRVK
ncbi:MAG: XdhC family protein [Acidocella sp.]|nr:XdhC family protein [Acidocella sp.]